MRVFSRLDPSWDYAESFLNDLSVKFQVVTEHDFRSMKLRMIITSFSFKKL